MRLGAPFLPQYGGWLCPSRGLPSTLVVKGAPPLPPNSDLQLFSGFRWSLHRWRTTMANCCGVHASTPQVIVCVTHKASSIVRRPSLEDTRAREHSFVLTVPLEQLIDLCAFNARGYGQDRRLPLPTGRHQRGHRDQGGLPRVATSLHAGELQPCQEGRGCPGEATQRAIKKNNLKLIGIYETWNK